MHCVIFQCSLYSFLLGVLCTTTIVLLVCFSRSCTDDLVTDMTVEQKGASGVSFKSSDTISIAKHTFNEDGGPSITVDCLKASWSMQRTKLSLQDISFIVNKVSMND